MITKEQLLELGFTEYNTGDPVMMKKILGRGEYGTVSIAVTSWRNIPELVIDTPDGQVYLNGVKNIDDVKNIMKYITGYEPNY